MNEHAEHHGIVGIFDALGAKNYSKEQIKKYFTSKSKITAILKEKAEDELPSLGSNNIKIFTFNDTFIIAYKSASEVTTDNEVKGYYRLICKFIFESLKEGILFRGAISVGNFIHSDTDNLILGEAVSDAASWYEKSEMICAMSTPKTTLFIDMFYPSDEPKPTYIMRKSEIETKAGEILSFTANWPILFYISKEVRENLDALPRRKFLGLITKGYIHFGTEKKYFNSVRYFDELHKLNMEIVKDVHAKRLERLSKKS